jgi:phosphate transport system substrate-binding protein
VVPSIREGPPLCHFSYLPSGSEAGIAMMTSGGADFATTDAPLTDRQLANARVLQFATILEAMVPVYNLPGVGEPIRFSPKALAGIYLGTITKWNDPAIAGQNPKIQLPSSDIAVIHSAAGLVPTYIWSDYLSKVSTEWRTRSVAGAPLSGLSANKRKAMAISPEW